jgi:molecular chaperone HtpG
MGRSCNFVRVDSDIVDNIIDKQEGSDSVLSKDETEQLKTMFSQRHTQPACNG